jgi:hypothetical protein
MLMMLLPAQEVKMKITKSNLIVSTFAIWSWVLKQKETETASLRAAVLLDEALERQRLEERLGEVQRNSRCVWRGVRLMMFLTALAVVGLGHSTVLIPDWPQTTRQFLMMVPIKAHCALGFASLSCALVFSGLGLSYRRELTRLRLEWQRFAGEMIASADPHVVPLPVGTGAESGLAESDFKDAA